MKCSRRIPLLVLLCFCIALVSTLSACNDDNKACMMALKERDKRIKEMQLTIVNLNNQLKNLRSVVQMKHKEVGIFRDTPITSSDAYQKCRLRADRLQAKLAAAEKERTEYKLRYQALKKRTEQAQ